MIQFNLLPDIKLEYIKAQRRRRVVLSVSLLITIAAVALLVLLLSVDGLQKKHLSDLNHDISSETKQLQGKPHINQILTVQNQLESLTGLHETKPAASRLFDYLDQLTPAPVDINNFTIDFTQQTVTITGDADSLSSVNQYVDTLKYTTYSSSGDSSSTKAFSDVVLSAFALTTGSAAQNGKPATYTITLSYDKNIFDITQTITLKVPTQTTTRSQLVQPTDLFTPSPAGTTDNGGGQ